MDEKKMARSCILIQTYVRMFLARKRAKERVKKHVMRTHAVHELMATEKSYCRYLKLFRKHVILKADPEFVSLFGDVESLIAVSKALQKPVRKVLKTWDYSSQMSDCFKGMWAQFHDAFIPYTNTFTQREQKVAELMKTNEKFGKFCDEQKVHLHLRGQNFLGILEVMIMPIQRSMRYVLLISELLKHSDPASEEFQSLTKVKSRFVSLNEALNEGRRSHDKALEEVSKLKGQVHGLSDHTPFIEAPPAFLRTGQGKIGKVCLPPLENLEKEEEEKKEKKKRSASSLLKGASEASSALLTVGGEGARIPLSGAGDAPPMEEASQFMAHGVFHLFESSLLVAYEVNKMAAIRFWNFKYGNPEFIQLDTSHYVDCVQEGRFIKLIRIDKKTKFIFRMGTEEEAASWTQSIKSVLYPLQSSWMKE